MIYPLVRELAEADPPIRVPVAVTCRVLKIARQPYYRWLAQPVTAAELDVRGRQARLREPPEIPLIEVRHRLKGHGLGTIAIEILSAVYPDRRLVAVSEEADGFWASLG